MLRQVIEPVDAMRSPCAPRDGREFSARSLEVDTKAVGGRLRELGLARMDQRSLAARAGHKALEPNQQRGQLLRRTAAQAIPESCHPRLLLPAMGAADGVCGGPAVIASETRSRW